MKFSDEERLKLGEFLKKTSKEKLGSQNKLVTLRRGADTTVKNLFYANGSVTRNTLQWVGEALGFSGAEALLAAAGIRDRGAKNIVFSELKKVLRLILI